MFHNEKMKKDLDNRIKTGGYLQSDIWKAHATYSNNNSLHQDIAKSIAEKYKDFSAIGINPEKGKVAFITSKISGHVTGKIFTDLFLYLKHLPITVYGCRDNSSYYVEKITANGIKFVDLSKLDDLDAAKQIAADKIETLIDISGYNDNMRLGILAHKPAKNIIHWQGTPSPLNAHWATHYITDNFISNNLELPTEKLLFLGDTYFTCPYVSDFQDVKLQKGKGRIRLGSANSNGKITKDIFMLWLDIMKELPSSDLYILTNTATLADYKKLAEVNGVSANRLFSMPFLDSTEKHLQRLKEIDIYLDTEYGGHTTVIEHLSQGSIGVTLKGNSYVSRVSSSIYNAVGLSSLICNDYTEYKNKVLELTTNYFLRKSLINNVDLSPVLGYQKAQELQTLLTEL